MLSILNNLSIYLAAINTCLICFNFFQYYPYRNKGIPYLRKCLAFVFVCIISSIISLVCLLLPEGKPLEQMVAINTFLYSLTNVFLAQISLSLTGNSSKLSIWLQRLFYIPVIVSAYYAITDLKFGYVIDYVTKMNMTQGVQSGISYGYTVQQSPYYVPINIICFGIVIIGMVFPLLTVKRSPYGNKTVVLYLIIAVFSPSLLQMGETLIEDLTGHNYHFNNLFSFLYVSIICYIFFGYVRTARRKAIQATHEIYVVFNKWGNLIDVNDQAVEFFRSNGVHTRPTLPQFLELIGADDNTRIENYEFYKDGSGWARYYSASTFSLSDGISQYCGSGFIIREITEYKQKMRQLNVIATIDPLTGAKNRRYFYYYADNMLKWACAHNQPITLLMMDIDHFKVINDEYGHTAGDEVLKRLCAICRQNLRKTDVIFRYGGEEFVIMCAGIGEKEGQMLSKRIIEAVNSHKFPISEGVVNASVSIGGCTFQPKPGEKIDDWVTLADQYLYRAKQNGRNRQEYYRKVEPV